MENMEICSSRITIRPYEISDADDFLVYAGDDNVTQFHRWTTFKSIEEACTYIKESCIPHPFCRSICLDNRSIGYVKVHPWSGNDRCKADTSYAIASKYWGKGIATRAVKKAIDQALKEFPEVMRVQGTVEVENMASQRLLERLGFVREGLMRKYTYNKGVVKDIVLFSLVI